MRKLWDRIKRQFGYYPGAFPSVRWDRFPWSATIEPKPRHAPIPLPELRQRIMDSVAAELEPRGFQRPSRRFETWVRRRTPYIYDLAGPHFVKSEPSIGMVQVGVNVDLHLPVVEKIYHQLAGGIYRIQFPTGGVPYPPSMKKKKLPRVWFFWATAYSEEATQMIIDQIIDYGLPRLEQVTDYESFLFFNNPFLYAEKKAILLALTGRTDEAQRLLEVSIEEQKSRHKGAEPLDTLPDWKAKVGLLEALRTGLFNELVEKAKASLEP